MKKYIALIFRMRERKKHKSSTKTDLQQPSARGFCFDTGTLYPNQSPNALKDKNTVRPTLGLYNHDFTTCVGFCFGFVFFFKKIKLYKHFSGLGEKSEWPKQKR